MSVALFRRNEYKADPLNGPVAMANDTQTYKRRMETEALLWDVIPTDPSGRTDISRIPRERAQSVANFAWEVCAFPSTMSTNQRSKTQKANA